MCVHLRMPLGPTQQINTYTTHCTFLCNCLLFLLLLQISQHRVSLPLPCLEQCLQILVTLVTSQRFRHFVRHVLHLLLRLSRLGHTETTESTIDDSEFCYSKHYSYYTEPYKQRPDRLNVQPILCLAEIDNSEHCPVLLMRSGILREGLPAHWQRNKYNRFGSKSTITHKFQLNTANISSLVQHTVVVPV